MARHHRYPDEATYKYLRARFVALNLDEDELIRFVRALRSIEQGGGGRAPQPHDKPTSGATPAAASQHRSDGGTTSEASGHASGPFWGKHGRTMEELYASYVEQPPDAVGYVLSKPALERHGASGGGPTNDDDEGRTRRWNRGCPSRAQAAAWALALATLRTVAPAWAGVLRRSRRAPCSGWATATPWPIPPAPATPSAAGPTRRACGAKRFVNADDGMVLLPDWRYVFFSFFLFTERPESEGDF
jgi:hypothetical protein